MERTIEQALTEFIETLPVGFTTRSESGGCRQTFGVGFKLEYIPESEDMPTRWKGSLYGINFYNRSLVDLLDEMKKHDESFDKEITIKK